MKSGLFHRDIELHGHNKFCPCSTPEAEAEFRLPCLCRECDLDDYYAAVDAAIEERKENPKKEVDDHD